MESNDSPFDNSAPTASGGGAYASGTRDPGMVRRLERRNRMKRRVRIAGWWLRGFLPRGWQDND